jgi:hypothetical protein
VPPSSSGQTRTLQGIPEHVDSDSDEDGEAVNFFSLGGDVPSSDSTLNTESSNLSQNSLKIYPQVTSKPVSFTGATADSTSQHSSMATFLSQMKTEERSLSPVSSCQDTTTSYNLTGLRGPYSSGPGPASDYSPAVSTSCYNEGNEQDSGAAVGYSGEVAEVRFFMVHTEPGENSIWKPHGPLNLVVFHKHRLSMIEVDIFMFGAVLHLHIRREHTKEHITEQKGLM